MPLHNQMALLSNKISSTSLSSSAFCVYEYSTQQLKIVTQIHQYKARLVQQSNQAGNNCVTMLKTAFAAK